MDVRRLPAAVLTLLACSVASGYCCAAEPLTGSRPDSSAAEATSSSPFGWIKMPTVTMPKVTMPKITMPKMPADPWAPFRTSARKVSDGAKKAWQGTKEIATLGRSSSEPQPTRVASRGESPTVMQRMFGGSPKEEDHGPQTIGEWMSQPRVDR